MLARSGEPGNADGVEPDKEQSQAEHEQTDRKVFSSHGIPEGASEHFTRTTAHRAAPANRPGGRMRERRMRTG
jgi:hypothetical protein